MDTPQQNAPDVATLSDRLSSRPEGLLNGQSAPEQSSVDNGRFAPNVEVELRATALGSLQPTSPSAESLAARAEFDRLIQELCSTDRRTLHSKNWLARFASIRAAKAANDILAKYQVLRLTLSLPDNSEFWQAARGGLLALRV